MSLSEFLKEQKMTTSNGITTSRRRKGLLHWLFPERIRESKCNECGRPYLEHPEREPKYRIVQGQVEVLLYEDKFGMGTEYKMRVGVWYAGRHGFHLGQLYSSEHMHDLQRAVSKAVGFVVGRIEVKQKGTAEKMSSRRS